MEVHARARGLRRRPARSSSTARSIRTSTSGRRPASSPPTSCSRRWATGLSRHQQARRSTAAWASTTPTSMVFARGRSATSAAAASRWRSACRPTWRRRRSPASARDELCKEFLVPSITGDYVACLGVSEVGAGSDVASIKTTARKDGGDYVINGGKMWTTNGTQADWMCLLANTGDGPGAQEQVADLPADEDQGRPDRPQARQARHARLRHGADLLRRRARAAALPDRRGGRGLHLPDAAVPGGAAVGGRRRPDRQGAHDRRDHRVHAASARPSASRSSTTRSCTSAWPSSRPRSRCCAR